VITSDDYTQASPLFDDINMAAPRELEPAFSARQVPVTAGYVGATRDRVTTTLGRGGSDYSAAIIGAALDAREIQIWTDVDGMLTADPRIVPSPQVVPQLSFGEASELAYFGAKVLHPSTILPAVARDIPVRILNSRRSNAAGTLIASHETCEDSGRIAAIACKRNITVVDITSTRMLMAYGFLRRVFEVFERHRTSVDVVTTSEVSVSVTLDDDRRLKAIMSDVSEFAEVRSESGMAILCAVGDALRQDPHIAARIIGALDGVPLRMVSQAASRRNVTVVLRDADVPAAMSRLHDLFFVPADAGRRETEAVGS
jgi:aspartate kinase